MCYSFVFMLFVGTESTFQVADCVLLTFSVDEEFPELDEEIPLDEDFVISIDESGTDHVEPEEMECCCFQNFCSIA